MTKFRMKPITVMVEAQRFDAKQPLSQWSFAVRRAAPQRLQREREVKGNDNADH